MVCCTTLLPSLFYIIFPATYPKLSSHQFPSLLLPFLANFLFFPPFSYLFPSFFLLFLINFPFFPLPFTCLSEDSFGCVFETDDSEAHRGVRLSKGTYLCHVSVSLKSTYFSFPIFLFYFPFISSLILHRLLFSSLTFSMSFYLVTEHTITFLDSPIISPALSPILLLCPIFPYLLSVLSFSFLSLFAPSQLNSTPVV